MCGTAAAKPWLVRVLRAVVAMALLAWIVRTIQWNDYTATDAVGVVTTHPGLARSLTEASPPWVIGALVASLLSMITVALRWRGLLRVQGIALGVGEAFRITFVAEVFSAVIPGMVGGDAVKAYLVARRSHPVANVLASVVVDRALGVSGMILVAGTACLTLWGLGALPAGAPWVAAILGGAMVMILGGLALRRFREPLRLGQHLDRLAVRIPVLAHARHVRDAFRRYRGGGLPAAVALTALAHVLGTTSVGMIGVGLRLEAPWHAYLLYVPLITLLAALPIAPGGLGVMEGLVLLFFAGTAAPERVAALAVLMRVVQVAGALPGALLLMRRGERESLRAVRRAAREPDPRHPNG